jgi:glucose/mannose-6-phosphate isomerase
MLDDLKLIHERDPRDTLGIAERQAEQLVEDMQPKPAFQPKTITRVVYGGMGGSALAALYMGSWPKLNLPFEVVRNYDIPSYVDENTLFIASSNSGNTEETISAIGQAAEQNAQIVVITTGGKLQEIAEANNYPLIVMPKAEQPRYAVFYNLKALIVFLEQAGLLLDADKIKKEMEDASIYLREAAKGWSATVPTVDNQAKKIALEVIGKSVVVYAGPKFAPAAYKWKISFNENAKHIAWTNQYPEFNHNEFIGWSKQPVDKPYAVIDLRSNFEHPRVQKRFEVSERLLSGMRPSPIIVRAEGDDILKQLLWVTMLGDFVTLYTAILDGINPAPVDLVEKFKQVLND